MKFINANKELLYKEIENKIQSLNKTNNQTNQMKCNYLQNLLKSLQKENVYKNILLDEDLSKMSLFFSEVVLIVINKIISVLESDPTSQEEIDREQADCPSIKIKILNLFYNLFPIEKKEFVLDNLTKLQEFISSKRNINIVQVSENFMEKNNTCFSLSKSEYGLLSETIFINSDSMPILMTMSICLMNEALYGFTLSQITQLAFNSKNILNYKITEGFPYFITPNAFNPYYMDLSNNADFYTLFIFTTAIFMEEESENNISLKEFIQISKGLKKILPSDGYNRLKATDNYLISLPTTIENIETRCSKRKEIYYNLKHKIYIDEINENAKKLKK